MGVNKEALLIIIYIKYKLDKFLYKFVLSHVKDWVGYEIIAS